MENCSPSGDEIPFRREEGNLILIEFQISIDRFWKLRIRGRSIESRGENKRRRYALQVENPDMWSDGITDARSNLNKLHHSRVVNLYYSGLAIFYRAPYFAEPNTMEFKQICNRVRLVEL